MIDTLINKNPWWQNKKSYNIEKKYYKREISDTLSIYLKKPQIIALIGLRRVGKSSLLFTNIKKELEQKKINPLEILYFDFEENKKQDLEEIIEIYLKEILEKSIHDIKKRVYIVLDEVQYAENWNTIIKKYYDQNKNIKFLITGSSSLFIKTKSRESLAGRIYSFHVQPLSFHEYLNFINFQQKINRIDLKKITSEEIKQNQKFNSLFKDDILKNFHKYIIQGEFPEIVDEKNKHLIMSYTKDSILDKALYQDIPLLFKINKQEELAQFFTIMARELGALKEWSQISKKIKINKNSLTKYVFALENAYLINVCKKYSTSFRGQQISPKKIIFESINLVLNLIKYQKNNPFFKDIIGFVCENYIYNRLKKDFESIYYFNDDKNEVDFIMKYENKIIPVEVKFREIIEKKDTDALVYFCNKYKLKKAVLITKNILEKEVMNNIAIYKVPFYFV